MTGVKWETIEVPPDPWFVLRQYCRTCGRQARFFYADRELITVEAIMDGGRWVRAVVGSSGVDEGATREPCTCNPPPPPPSLRRMEQAVGKAVAKGLGDRWKSRGTHVR